MLLSVLDKWNGDPIIAVRRRIRNLAEPHSILTQFMEFDRRGDVEYHRLLRLPEFFEILATLVDQETVPAKVIIDHFGDPLRHYWPLLEPCVHACRATYRSQDIYSGFERLATAAGIEALTKRLSPRGAPQRR